MKKKLFGLAFVATLAFYMLGGCSCSNEPKGPYRVTLYSGSEVAKEWDFVSDYVRWDSNCTSITVDGEEITVIGGLLIIEDGVLE